MNAADQSMVSKVSCDRLAVAPKAKPSRLWLWFVAVFLLQLAAWGAWFVIASQHRVAEVPLERAAGNKR